MSGFDIHREMTDEELKAHFEGIMAKYNAERQGRLNAWLAMFGTLEVDLRDSKRRAEKAT